MKKKPLFSPWPYWVLTALFSLIPVLNHEFPLAFYPSVPMGWIDILSVLAGSYAAFKAIHYGWAILQFRILAQHWIHQALEERKVPEKPDPNEVVNAGRLISRLVRNVDEDLKEIKPDFTIESLRRLDRYMPELLMEVESLEAGRIRLGIVGVYIGETLCRERGWEWFFKPDPSLKQFSFLPSVIRKNGKILDPFEIASRGFKTKRTWMRFLGDIS